MRTIDLPNNCMVTLPEEYFEYTPWIDFSKVKIGFLVDGKFIPADEINKL